jgi:uncharacterized protein YjiS (DUF1127 family)
MSAILATTVRPEIAKRPGAFAQLFGAYWVGIARHFIRRAAVARLRDFDDHLLQDIGLERAEIEAAVYGDITRSELASTR